MESVAQPLPDGPSEGSVHFPEREADASESRTTGPRPRIFTTSTASITVFVIVKTTADWMRITCTMAEIEDKTAMAMVTAEQSHAHGGHDDRQC
jgi:hypothetical protein